MGYINNNDSPRTRCAKGKPTRSIYKIKVAASSNHHQNRNNLQVETHTKNEILPPLIKYFFCLISSSSTGKNAKIVRLDVMIGGLNLNTSTLREFTMTLSSHLSTKKNYVLFILQIIFQTSRILQGQFKQLTLIINYYC